MKFSAHLLSKTEIEQMLIVPGADAVETLNKCFDQLKTEVMHIGSIASPDRIFRRKLDDGSTVFVLVKEIDP